MPVVSVGTHCVILTRGQTQSPGSSTFTRGRAPRSSPLPCRCLGGSRQRSSPTCRCLHRRRSRSVRRSISAGDADDDAFVDRCAEETLAAMQSMLDRLSAGRRPWLGKRSSHRGPFPLPPGEGASMVGAEPGEGGLSSCERFVGTVDSGRETPARSGQYVQQRTTLPVRPSRRGPLRADRAPPDRRRGRLHVRLFLHTHPHDGSARSNCRFSSGRFVEGFSDGDFRLTPTPCAIREARLPLWSAPRPVAQTRSRPYRA